MHEAVRAAILRARHELAAKNVRGDVIIELEQREWNHFKRSLPTSVHMVLDFNRFDGSADSCQFEGAVVRLKR